MKNIKKKVLSLDIKHDLGLRHDEYNQVVAKLNKSKFDSDKEEYWIEAINSMVRNFRSNPLKNQVVANAEKDSKKCPVCGSEGQEVTLMNSRKAYYCDGHNVVTPIIKN
jgi:hypothetical protein